MSQDRPILQSSEDSLDRGGFIDSLVRALVTDQRDQGGALLARHATGYVLGLTGRWGLGKSSVLNMLSLQLGSMAHVNVAIFNPWLFRGRDELLVGFFNALRAALGRSTREEIKEVRKSIDRYWGAINFAGHAVAGYAAVHGAPGANGFWSKFGDAGRAAVKSEELSPQDERMALEKKIRASNSAIVVLIDELDRVEDEDVRAVAQLVKAVGDIQGISYLVAYDPDRVADALGRGIGEERRRSGERYLEKIIQHPIPLRPMFGEDFDRLLTAAIAQHGAALRAPASDDEKEILEHLRHVISTPREVKRLVSAYTVLEAAVRGEVSPYDVLGYCWILTQSPSLQSAIALAPDKLVDDPSEKEMIARIFARRDREPGRKEEPETPFDILGASAQPHDALLKLLFPRFAESRTKLDDGTRIRRRRNLIRLLYLGNPPGMVSRVDLERLWALPSATEASARLEQWQAAGRLPAVIDRLDDIIGQLPEAGDAIFWPVLARCLTRKADWVVGPETERAIADDAATMLMRLALRDPRSIPRFKAAMEYLIASGDLVIAPFVLRKHLFVYGLTRHGAARGGEAIYTDDETRNLLAREAPRYLQALIDGIALRRVPNVEALYVLSNAQLFEPELRQALTEQLDSQAAISTLAAMLVPPGHATTREALDQILDVGRVLAVFEGFGDPVDWGLEPWVTSSAKRFRAYLQGRDPSFPDE